MNRITPALVGVASNNQQVAASVHAMTHLMSLVFVSIFAIVCSVSSVFAQGNVQTGFAAVQPVVGSGAGLQVFGKVTYPVGDEVFHSNIWAGSIVTATTMVVSTDSSSAQDTGIAIVNASNFTATITLSLTNQQGGLIATRTLTLGALHQMSRFVSELFGVNATGLLSINSTAAVVVLGLQYDGAAFSLVPTNAPPTETALVLPQVVTGGGLSTQVVISNGAATAQIVRLDFYNSDGVIVASVPNVNIPPLGLVVINR